MEYAITVLLLVCVNLWECFSCLLIAIQANTVLYILGIGMEKWSSGIKNGKNDEKFVWSIQFNGHSSVNWPKTEVHFETNFLYPKYINTKGFKKVTGHDERIEKES